MKTRNHRIYWASLIILFTILIAAVIPQGYVYGSNTDWLSQHVTLAETIRDACLDQRTLLPSWIGLGGGSNGFQFSYYGFMRPDILIGCLLPQVPMLNIVIGYMLVLFLASVLLCFAWLRSEGVRDMPAWAGSVLFLTAGCLFHMHRQIMFVNYLPYLLLAFLCIRKKRHKWLPLCMLLICLSSFYFAISAFVAIGWYWYRSEGRSFWKGSFLRRYLPSAAAAVGMSAALLIPTALALLEHRRNGSSSGLFGLLELLAPNPVFNNLLFNEYGMGLTFVCLYGILAGLAIKKRRADSILFLLFGLFGIFSYVLNGTLYARPKILIPFMPLVVLHAVRILAEKKESLPLWPFAVMIPSGLLWISQKQFPWILADATLLLLLILIRKFGSRLPRRFASSLCGPLRERLFYLALLAAPIGLYLTTAGTEDWVKNEDISPGITAEESESVGMDPLYHFDSLLSPLVSGNELFPEITRSTMYSSITNQAYSDLYYDTLLTPIRINNRVALLTSDNPFMLNLLGVRYLETEKDAVPAGYKEIFRSGDTVIAENERVLPMAYFTGDTVSQNWFDTLTPAQKLSVIAQKTVVQDGASRSDTGAVSAAEGVLTYTPDLSLSSGSSGALASLPDGLEIRKAENGWEIYAKKDCTLTLDIQNPAAKSILLCGFKVENLSRSAVVIDINGMRNKLSGTFAPYPNGNNVFHYQFSDASPQGVSQLKVTFSKGKYRLTDPEWYVCDSELFTEKEYTPLTLEYLQSAAHSGNKAQTDAQSRSEGGIMKGTYEVLQGTVRADQDGCLVTSIPLQNGLSIVVDGKETEPVTVNQAFAGAALTEGEHTIEIRFSPPGRQAGIIISLISVVGYGLYLIASKRRKHL